MTTVSMPVFDRRENAVSMPLSTRFPYSLCRTRPSQSEVISHVSKMQLNNLSHHEPVEDNATILSLQAATNIKLNYHQTFDFMLVSLFLNIFFCFVRCTETSSTTKPQIFLYKKTNYYSRPTNYACTSCLCTPNQTKPQQISINLKTLRTSPKTSLSMRRTGLGSHVRYLK